MNTRFIPVLLIALTACGDLDGNAQAANPQVAITAPAPEARLPAHQPIALSYHVDPSVNGDHVHIMVDNGAPVIVKNLGGTYALEGLPPGIHTVRVQEVTRGHGPTGHEARLQLVVVQ